MTLIDITAELRQDRELSYMIYEGKDDENGKEVWVSLPKSQVEYDGDMTFTMPEWLALDKELI